MTTGASTAVRDPFGVRQTLSTGGQSYVIHSLPKLADAGVANVERLPYVIRILLENILRHVGSEFATEADARTLATWDPAVPVADAELAFLPARVVLQDFTGVPCVVDLAAMRSAVDRLGGDVGTINPLVPVDLVIDHSVQVDRFGTMMAYAQNVDLEYERNRERYMLLRWAQQSMKNFRVVPPGTVGRQRETPARSHSGHAAGRIRRELRGLSGKHAAPARRLRPLTETPISSGSDGAERPLSVGAVIVTVSLGSNA